MSKLTIDNLAVDSGNDAKSDRFILHLLENVIRPNFSNSEPSTVTPQGRKAINVVHKPARVAIDNSNRPWRTQDVINIFAYTITTADVIVSVNHDEQC